MAEKTKATQKFVDVDRVENGVIYMKNGALRKALIVNGINFSLKSEEEQEIILGSFQNFLNGLDFPVQIFIHSRKININSYLEKIRERIDIEKKELLKVQIEEYAKFIESFVEENPIITKNFFVVVPYKPIKVVEKTKKGLGGIINSLTGKNTKEETDKEESEAKKIQQLDYRVDEVRSGLEQVGLRVKILKDEELTELLYNLYNPQFIEKERK